MITTQKFAGTMMFSNPVISQKDVWCTYGTQLKPVLIFSVLVHKKHFYHKTWLFLGSKNFFMRDCFSEGIDDSKPVEDFLRRNWTPAMILMELEIDNKDRGLMKKVGWGLWTPSFNKA